MSALDEAVKDAADAIDAISDEDPEEIEIEIEIVVEEVSEVEPGASKKATEAIQAALNVFAESVSTDELPALTVEGSEIEAETVTSGLPAKIPVIHLDDEILDKMIQELEKPGRSGEEATSEHAFHAESLKVELDRTRTRLEIISADFARYKNRAEKQQTSTKDSIIADVVSKLLPVMDNLDRAVVDEKLESGKKIALLEEGLAMVNQQFHQVMSMLEVTEVPAKGAPFNPIHHDAMELVFDTEAEEGTILECIQKGYSLPDRLIRPAKVRVATRLRSVLKPATDEHITEQLRQMEGEELTDSAEEENVASLEPESPPEAPEKEETEPGSEVPAVDDPAPQE